MQIGGYDVRLLDAGPFRLDGGGLFGVVPWTLWHAKAQPDELNRVRIAATCLLLTGHGRRVLIETGWGDKLNEKEREMFGLENPAGVLSVLAARGVQPDSLDAVIVSHLHFDHVGGATTFDSSGRPVPAFGDARLFVQEREWQDAVRNRSHMKTTYREENLRPLADAGCLELLDGPAEILPNIRVEPTPGHTFGHQSILVGDGGGTLCFAGDLIPTRHHLRPFWTTSYDIEPATVNATRERIIGRAIEEEWVVVLPHDLVSPAVRVRLDEKGRWTPEPVSM